MERSDSSVEQQRSYKPGEIFRVGDWSKWLQVSEADEEYSGVKPPSDNFLMPIQLMLQSCDSSAGFDIIGDPKSRGEVSFMFTVDHPVSLAQVIEDVTYWPIGTGISLFCDSDGCCCAYIRGRDSTIARYYQLK